MDKKKKGMLLIAISMVVLAVAVFMMRDTTDMAEVEKAQDANIEAVTSEVLTDDNDLFSDDVDFGDVEIAPLALDTTKAEK